MVWISTVRGVCCKNIPHYSISFSTKQLQASIYYVVRSVYRLFFHPLAKYPGPKFAAITDICIDLFLRVSGRYPWDMEYMHMMYGDVVRTGPNELTFATPQSFNGKQVYSIFQRSVSLYLDEDIYGHATKERSTFIKGTFYEHGQPEPGIVAERDPEKHRETRRLLSHGFSTKALKDQEDILHKYSDLFVAQIRRHSNGTALNMKEVAKLDSSFWFNWLSFDVIGELAFGESFGTVQSGRTIGILCCNKSDMELAKPHFWIETIHDGAFLVTLFEVGRRLPWLWPLIILVLPSGIKRKFDLFLDYSKKQVQKRVARQDSITRTDFFVNLLSERSGNVSEEWLIAQANVLVIAGSDTTATALATIIYYLTRYPQQLDRLCCEIREAFPDQKKMTDVELQSLPYLSAVIEEGLRIFPPTAFGLPRISPGATVDSHFVPPGVTVSTSSWTTTRRENYWKSARSFIPERWLPQAHTLYDNRFAADNHGAAKPFSLGPRGCLGVNLANMEMRITLAKLVWNFDMKPDGATRLLDWERESRFEGFWNIPAPMIRFEPR
ncbi:cytochrome P450 [Aureobasidium subglaciale]|nr:cytochrome P450 [Aureobasidium subglaciale]KAI5213611.1 cytochrome P450 [Aureobasidium subglaciale]KAI5215282.1 cytochrome P450 [Aureobasidium subglaciale]KAI5253264.1 cytochrome P450 [Aureobasidium subglaciale]